MVSWRARWLSRLVRGVRGLGWVYQWQWQGLALHFGADNLQAVMDEAEAIFQAGDNHTLDAGKRRGTPVGAMGAPVVACRRQAANVPLAAVVIRWHTRVMEEGE